MYIKNHLQFRHGENSLTSSAVELLATKQEPTGSRCFNLAVTNDT